MGSGYTLLGGLMSLVLGIVIVIAIFLIFRALVLWYFRINEVVALLQSINRLLKKQILEA